MTLKVKLHYITLALLLICALLLAQVGATFFHNNHDVHFSKAIDKPLQDGKASIQAHGDHCKLCAIDFFHQALTSSTLTLALRGQFNSCPAIINFELVTIDVSSSQGRAPPVHFS